PTRAPARGLLAALPDWFPLLGERAWSLDDVLAREELLHERVVAGHRVEHRLREPLERRLLRRLHRERRALEDLPRPALRRGVELLRRDDLVDEADAVRFGRRHVPS